MQVLSGFRPIHLGARKPSMQEMEANMRRLQRDALVQTPGALEIPEDFVPDANYQPGSFANYMGV